MGLCIGVDFDEVVADLLPVWLARYNKEHGTHWTSGDLTQWKLHKDLGCEPEAIYKHLTPDIYDDVKPVPDALDAIRDIENLGHKVLIVTTCAGPLPDETFDAKVRWLSEHGLNHLAVSAIPIGKRWHHKDKSTVDVNWLIDDNIEHVESFPGYALLVTRPHNRRTITTIKRIRGLQDVVPILIYSQARLPETFELEEGLTEVKYDVKPTNPKDGIGAMKVPLHLVSPVAKAYAAVAHFLGNVKYGAWNWRTCGARASIYKGALERHIDRWWEGEENDPADGTPHLANAQACLNILIDCKARGNLIDDRPPSQSSISEVYKDIEEQMKQIAERYKDRNPRHYTIADTETK